ncbi:MAG: ABC transporter permease, partial [Flavobacteriales bacterium]
YAVLGYGIASALAVYINGFDAIRIYAAKRGVKVSLNPEQAFEKMSIQAAGIFSINPDFDDHFVLVPFGFAAELLHYKDRVTAVEIGLEEGRNTEKIRQQIAKIAGKRFEIKTRYERNELIFKTNRTEKWITFLILSFILIIATFNVIGSLTMLIIDKKEDIFILKGMGADKGLIRRIFLWEGLLINIFGGTAGMLLGALLCWGQQTIGFIRLQGTVVEYYPVQMQISDFVSVFSIVLCIGFFSTWLPVQYLTRKYFRISKIK